MVSKIGLGHHLRSPYPWHNSVYWLCCAVLRHSQSCPTLCNPLDCGPPSSSVHGDSLGKNTGLGSLSLSSGDLHDQGIKLGSPVLQADSLPAELPGKSMHWLATLNFLSAHFDFSILPKGHLGDWPCTTFIPSLAKNFQGISLWCSFFESYLSHLENQN